MPSLARPAKTGRAAFALLAACSCHVLPSPQVGAATPWDATRAGNPVIPGYFADPCSRKFGDTYYIYVTPDGWDVGRGPAGVWSSKDFVNWTWQPMNWPKTEFKWAPSVVKYRDKFYMYSSVPCQIWAASADSPVGPWTNLMGEAGKEMIPDQTPKGTIVLDGEAFIDDDQSVYLWYSTWWRPTVVKLKPDMRTFDGEPIQYFKHEGLQNPPKGLVTGCMEAPYMFKRKGTYYLMYSDAFCQDSTYNVKYSTSTSPTGPFDHDPAKNPILETTDDGTVDGPGHHSLLVDGDRVYIVYHRHDNPHDPDGAHRQTCVSELHFAADGSIEKIQPGHLGVGYLAPSTKRDTNLALGRPAAASSFLTNDFKPAHAVDQNNGTLWKAGDKSYPQWLQVDLGKVSPVRRVETEFQYPQVPNRYVIETSADGKEWRVFADRKENKEPGVMIDRGDTQARHVRITLLGQDSGRPDQWAALWGFRVYDGIDKPNQAPVVELGESLKLNFRYPGFTLEGAVHDDGLPNGPVSVRWSQVSGPGKVSFTHPDRVRTAAAVDQAGTYVVKLTADDGSLKGEGTLRIEMAEPTARVLALDFDETSGALAADASGNGRSGVLRKGATRGPGMRGNAANLDGADDHVAVPPIGALKAATIAAWINPHELHPDSAIFCGDAAGSGTLRLVLNGEGAVQLAIEGQPPVASGFRFGPANVGEWHHVAVTWDPRAKSVGFFIDGKPDVTRATEGAGPLAFPKPARIGGAESGARGFNGEIDEFRLFESVLPQAEITTLARRAAFLTVAEAKRLKDGAPVTLVGKPVTFAPADPLSLDRSTGFFYVSDFGGEAGIRVENGKTGQDKCRAGACVSLTGKLGTLPGGERFIELAAPPAKGATREAKPGQARPAALSSDLGRFVTVHGRVKDAAADNKSLAVETAAGTPPVEVLTAHCFPLPKLETGNTVEVAGVVALHGEPARPVLLARELVRLQPAATDTLAAYSFEDEGATAKDSSPNHQDAKLPGGANREPGKQGKALALDGGKAFLEVPDLGLQPALTIALWLRLDGYAKDTYASVLHCDGWGWGDFHWNVASDNKKLNVHINGIGELHSRFEFTPEVFGSWVHAAVTYDAKSRSLKLYVNGVEEAGSGIQAPRAINLAKAKFGCWNGRERWWKGSMDQIRVFNRALPPEEIKALADTGQAGGK